MLRNRCIALLLILTFLVSACGGGTETPPPTASLTLPTQTPILPTLTSVAPTQTPVPPTPTSPPPTPTTSLPPLTGTGDEILAFTSEQNGKMDLYAMNADGSDQHPLTFDSRNDGWAAWSPDGTQIAYHSVQGSLGILNILNVMDGSIRQLEVPLEGGLWEPAWSHTGNRIAFSNQTVRGESDLYFINSDGTDLIRLTDTAGYDGGPYWSPDDSQIAFYSDRDGNFEVYVMNADGSNQRRLTDNRATDLATSWSPDGTRLAFFSDRDGNDELYTVNADGSNLTRLTDNAVTDREPAFSPDGTKIAFVSNRDGNLEIYVADTPAVSQPIDESTIRRLTDTPAREMLPVWKPITIFSTSDGNSILTVSNRMPAMLDGPISLGERNKALQGDMRCPKPYSTFSVGVQAHRLRALALGDEATARGKLDIFVGSSGFKLII